MLGKNKLKLGQMVRDRSKPNKKKYIYILAKFYFV